MAKIPPTMREEMANDPFYLKCCLASLGGCGGRIEWHHVLTYGGKQIQEIWAIVPACHEHHMKAAPLNDHFLKVALNRATDDQLLKYSKAINYLELRKRLNDQ